MTSFTFDPLSTPRFTDGTGGLLKQRPEDFLVYEIPMYEPCGEGEHLYVRIRRNGVSHDDMISAVTRAWGVKVRDIGFAGIKDTKAVTEQTISIHLPEGRDQPSVDDDRIDVLWTDRHGNKLRRGHLDGNRFVVRIREVNPLKVTIAWNRLQAMAEQGVPNAFGPQRFGRVGDNHLLARMLLLEDWDGLAACLADGRGGRLESSIRRSLGDGSSPARACRLIPGRMRRFWNDSLQSAIFNAVLTARMDRGDWARPVVGDMVWNHDTRRTFLFQEEDRHDEATMRRIEEGALVPTGPMWGRAMRSPADDVAAFEQEVIDGIDPELAGLLVDAGRSKGTRRPLAVRLTHPAAQSEMDQHGGCIMVQFELPPGAYATSVLRELIGAESPASPSLEEV